MSHAQKSAKGAGGGGKAAAKGKKAGGGGAKKVEDDREETLQAVVWNIIFAIGTSSDIGSILTQTDSRRLIRD